ncbi:glyoxylase-like metal-dependent hydrolase (beta-lactamase superfamily II) [Nocardiopsis arvandica]|uniref:Glyoxylase-like metal-dependent hydrolase (Beta-lactamase superfamily II) n=1 Tax=Nocardiopsis sinuspersici TaxID=501010 RepID=A0A7Y9X9U9_9ACTN|nr:glyoxylase-like metal-dependent hydrolase (beta-lactamase superfamily II) [Nocardiopsis sinuspersici]
MTAHPTEDRTTPAVLIAALPTGPLAANCYVLAPAPGGDCVIVDPGQEATEQVDKALAEHSLTPVAVLLTHGHFDHVWSAAEICERHGVPVHLHAADRGLLTEPASGVDPGFAAQLSALLGPGPHTEPEEMVEVSGGDTLTLAGLDFEVEHTPGHTPGSVVYTVATEDGVPVMFAGDLVFAGSIGRTDFPGGDHAAMLRSLASAVLGRPDDTQVLPGHGPATTVGRERTTNPYLRDTAG